MGMSSSRVPQLPRTTELGFRAQLPTGALEVEIVCLAGRLDGTVDR
jgi:hypothetical protein